MKIMKKLSRIGLQQHIKSVNRHSHSLAASDASRSNAAESMRHTVAKRIAHLDSHTPSPVLTDSFGRHHNYLRISLTEKCNLRCTYCMPENGVPLLPSQDRLTTPEIERLARLFVSQGVTKIRLTGGEPTVRKDLLDVVERLGRLPLTSLGMTSNAISLKRKLPKLVQAGLTSLNISLDTLDPFKFQLMTRRNGFETVLETVELAKELRGQGLQTKINCVVIKGLNDDEVPAFVELTKDSDITVRFIEYMPFEDNRWSTTKLVPSSSLLSQIRTIHPSIEKVKDSKNDTTRAWKVPGYRGRVGFISSMTDHFCGTCSRLRVGTDGQVKVCLFGPPVLSLRPLLRASPPLPDSTILRSIGQVVQGKKFAHDGLEGRITHRVVTHPAATPNRERFATRYPASRFPFLPYTRTPPTLASSYQISNFSSTAASPSSSTKSPLLPSLTHIDPRTGKPSMVSVTSKPWTARSATAVGTVYLGPQTVSLLSSDPTKSKKGDPLTVAQLAGVMGAKQTAGLIPLCHPISLTNVKVELELEEEKWEVKIKATVECFGPTGVEMEALTAVSTSALTLWDMCKSVGGKEMRIEGIKVIAKTGGKSGDWERMN
ncbi:molybdenum cofactor biosynthesis prote [Meredithblackwellia eburnea MCA 4105]